LVGLRLPSIIGDGWPHLTIVSSEVESRLSQTCLIGGAIVGPRRTIWLLLIVLVVHSPTVVIISKFIK
jgi:hypothetical protein